MKGLAKRFVSHKGEAYAVDIPKKKKVDDSIGFFGLWRYATITERLITIIAVTVSWCCAGGLVLAVALYGELTALFVSRHTAVRAEAAVILGCFGGGRILPPGNRTLHMDALVEDSMAFLWASIAVMAIQLTTAAVAVGLANWAAHRMVNRLRWRLLRAVLGQEMAFFDTNTSLDIVATLTEDMEKLRSGVGEHVSMTSYLAGTVALCLCTAVHAGWLLTLAAVAVVPVAAGTAAVVSKYQTRCAEEESQAYGVAARVVEEALAGVRTVRAYGGEEGEVERYSSLLTPARAAAGRRGRWAGAGAGAGWLLTYALNAVVFALGARLVARDLLLPPEEQEYNPRVLVTILFTTFMAAQNIAMCQPHLEVFTQARAAARSAYRLLERKPTIDVDAADSGAERVRPDKFKGDITFENIYFNYPARPDVKVLRGLTLNIQSGTTVAFVGSSGCGKSTLLQLLQRLYEPDHGRITVDGHPLRNIDLKYFRQSIGVVGQEPVLFSGTILDNITLGMAHVSQDAVEKAATMANAHEFISKLPDGYNTLVGERGASLSGGQKQRVAIARALLRNPSVLLLDEPTAALDPTAERLVQSALDAASVGRTTLVVSHRLTTIEKATRIIYMEQGCVLESGTHEELLAKQGAYWKLYQHDSKQSQATSGRTPERACSTDEDGAANASPTAATLGDTELTRSVVAQAAAAAAEVHSQAILDQVTHLFEQSTSYNYDRTSRTSRQPAIAEEVEDMVLSSAESTPFHRAQVGRHSTIRESFMRGSRRFGSVSSVQPPDVTETELPSDSGPPVSAWALLRLHASEWKLLSLGGMASFAVGATMPVFALLFSKLYGMFSSSDPSLITSESQFYSTIFLLVAGACGALCFLQVYLYNRAGTKLVCATRVKLFRHYLYQEQAWFDEACNSVGALCARLTTDCAAIQGASGTQLGTVLQGISTMSIGVTLAMFYSWKMTLVSLLSVPCVIGGICLEGYMTRLSGRQAASALDQAGHVVSEALANVRTVQALGVESTILSRYSSALDLASRSNSGRWLRGLSYGACLCAPTLGYAVSLAYGGYLIAREGLQYEYAILVSEALIYGAWMLAEALSFAPSFAAARRAGTRLGHTLARRSGIGGEEESASERTEPIRGSVSFTDVHFNYPSRSNPGILRGVRARALPGQTVALVGKSGCGKSTLLRLVMRDYDVNKGSIQLDGTDIRSMSPRSLRSCLGLVQQEAVLFSRSLRENIAYGASAKNADLSDVINAARMANVHEFIASLPMGYETCLSSGGASLSGGQKQRVGIARALLRNPSVLLLDEPTSALDATSEQSVSEALRQASVGRTTLVIAHRLATVRHADVIYVIDQGVVAESGTHDELLQKRGIYYELWQQQTNLQ